MSFFFKRRGKNQAEQAPSEPAMGSASEVSDTPPVDLPNDPDATPAPIGSAVVTRPFPEQSLGVTRQLSPEAAFPKSVRHLIFGKATNQGMVRANNQDSAVAFLLTSSSVDERPDVGLFIVADGMGGHLNGERASALAIKVVANQILREVLIPAFTSGLQMDADRPTIAESLIAAVKNANLAVIREIVEDSGTTLTGIVVVGEMIHIAHVGDSRAYLVRNKAIEKLTRDHSLVQRLIELNQLSPEDRHDHPQRSILYRAIGQNEGVEVDTLTRRLPPESLLLICSDGLWDCVPEAEILDILLTHEDPRIACEQLIVRANDNGGPDNITAIVIKSS